jgi:hypothetical protein
MDGSHRTDLGNYKRNWSHRARIEARTLRQTPDSTIFSSTIMMQKHAASGVSIVRGEPYKHQKLWLARSLLVMADAANARRGAQANCPVA